MAGDEQTRTNSTKAADMQNSNIFLVFYILQFHKFSFHLLVDLSMMPCKPTVVIFVIIVGGWLSVTMCAQRWQNVHTQKTQKNETKRSVYTEILCIHNLDATVNLKCANHLPHNPQTRRHTHTHLHGSDAHRRHFNIEYNWMSWLARAATHVTMTCDLEFIFVYSMSVHLSYKYFKIIHFHVPVPVATCNRMNSKCFAFGRVNRVSMNIEDRGWWCNARFSIRKIKIQHVHTSVCAVCDWMCWYANSIFASFCICFSLTLRIRLRRSFYRHFLKMHIFCAFTFIIPNHFQCTTYRDPTAVGTDRMGLGQWRGAQSTFFRKYSHAQHK